MLLKRAGIFMLLAAVLGTTAMADEPWVAAKDFDPDAPPVDEMADMPFEEGERIVTKLYWSMFYVGSAVFEVRPITTKNGERAFHFVMTARTNSFADKIYKVRENVQSYVTTDMKRSLHYSKHHTEGKDQKEIEVAFDWDAKTVTYSNYDDARDPVTLEDGTLDPLTVFYYARWAYKPGMTEMSGHVTDGKKVVDSQIHLVRKEKITVNGRTYDTLLIEPDLKDLGGVFKKSKNAKIQVWVTDDDRRIPVKISSKVVVGKFVAYITDVQKITDFDNNTAESVIADLDALEANKEAQTAGGEKKKEKSFFGRLFD